MIKIKKLWLQKMNSAKSKDTLILVEHQRQISQDILDLCANMKTVLITRSTEKRIGFDKVIAINDNPIETIDLEQLKTANLKGSFGAYTPYEEAILDCEKLCKILNLPSNGFKTIHDIRNKFYFRQKLSKSLNLHVHHSLVKSGSDISSFFKNGIKKAIIKPLLGSGSLLTKAVGQSDNHNKLYDEMVTLASKSKKSEYVRHSFYPFTYENEQIDPCHHFLIEECIDGRELSVEAIVVEGSLTILAIHQAATKENRFEDSSFIAPAPLSKNDREQIHNILQETVDIFGLKNRVICAEIMFSKTPKLIEINLRPGGLDTVKSVEFLSNVHLHKEGILLALGKKSQISIISTDKAYGFLAFYAHKTGIFKGIRNIKSILEKYSPLTLKLYFKKNDKVSSELEDIPYLGYVACYGDNYFLVEKKLKQIVSELDINIE